MTPMAAWNVDLKPIVDKVQVETNSHPNRKYVADHSRKLRARSSRHHSIRTRGERTETGVHPPYGVRLSRLIFQKGQWACRLVERQGRGATEKVHRLTRLRVVP